MGRFYTNWYKKTSEKFLLISFLNYIKKRLNAMLYVAANRRLNSMPFATPWRWPIGQDCMFVVFFRYGVKDCLWTAKSCVVPTKVNTVRRLELMMIVLLSKLVVLVKFAAEKMLKVILICKLIWKDWKLWVEIEQGENCSRKCSTFRNPKV